MIRFLFIILLLMPIVTSAQDELPANEGAGLIVSDVDGALPKGLFRNQSRSEITYLLKISLPLRLFQFSANKA